MLTSSLPPLLLLSLLLLPPGCPASPPQPPSSVQGVDLEGFPLSHLLQDLRSGALYVGGVDHLYQLTSDLRVIAHIRTGPQLDSPTCLPPIIPKDCPSATPTHNYNKLLLLEEAGPEEEGVEADSLIVCGTLFQGICEKRRLSNITELLYHNTYPVEGHYVATNDPGTSTVAVIITTEMEQEGTGHSTGRGAARMRLMLVGRGYTKGPGDIPAITTRRLFPAIPPQRMFSQEEELGKLVVRSYSEYNNHFVKAFVHGEHVYFLLLRRDVWHKKEYKTYASRLCLSDRSFYSYVEVPLLCEGGYNLAQGAWLGNHTGSPALFVVMSVGQASTPVATNQSALCVYSMEQLDAMMKRAQELCYTEGGRGSSGQEEAYVEYQSSWSRCLQLPKDSVVDYPCGFEHTPSPIASSVPLKATPTFRCTTHLSAVATATEAGLTIAFMGDQEGTLHKVLVHENTTGHLYSSVPVHRDSPVSPDLLLDQNQEYVYVLTQNRLSKVPVSSCEQQTDCGSCLSMSDPYCGWCILQGRCTRKHECEGHLLPNHWLWSFNNTDQCVRVDSLQRANQSRDAQTEEVPLAVRRGGRMEVRASRRLHSSVSAGGEAATGDVSVRSAQNAAAAG